MIARRLHELADLVHRENGKPHADAILEIALAVDHVEWAAKHAPKVLGPRKVSAGLMAANQAASVEYQPLGVVGVIGPWNYPVFTPMGSLAYALAAGNAVVFKPSEHTPGVGSWLADAWTAAVPERPDVLQVVHGLGETGAALTRAGVDKIAFTGSAATGRRVMAACAEGLVPVLMECGGKDAMIVDDDADVAAAADAALWGGMSNAGQTCIGIERVYATDKVYDAFVAELTRAAPACGPARTHDGVVRPDHHARTGRRDPAAPRRRRSTRGGRALTGGTVDGGLRRADRARRRAGGQHRRHARRRSGRRSPWRGCATPRRPCERTNATTYGLAGAVFTGSRSAGMDLARRMRCGHDQRQLGDLVRLGAGAAVRRGRRLRVRAHPRRGRAQGVHPRQGDHPAAVRAADAAAELPRGTPG